MSRDSTLSPELLHCADVVRQRFPRRVGKAVVTADVAHERGRVPLEAGTRVRLEVPASEIRLMAGS